MDEHPLIYFRDGASGRRPALLGTRLDVAIGRFVEALDAFLRRHQGDDACRNQVQWLGGSAAVGGATPPAPIRRAGAGE
jgi:hypothetical protein